MSKYYPSTGIVAIETVKGNFYQGVGYNIGDSSLAKYASGKQATVNVVVERVNKNFYQEPAYDANDDYLVRYASGKQIASVGTTYFKEKIYTALSVASEVISSLKSNLDYNGYYIAYLLDQMSEEEFGEIAEKYSTTYSADNSAIVAEKIRILFSISEEHFSISELANIFKIEESIVEGIVVNLKDMKLIRNGE